jgi:hypothetical protein
VISKIPIKTKIIIMNRDDFIVLVLLEIIDPILLYNTSKDDLIYFNSLAKKAQGNGILISLDSKKFNVQLKVPENELFKKFLELSKLLKREEFNSINPPDNINVILKSVLQKF